MLTLLLTFLFPVFSLKGGLAPPFSSTLLFLKIRIMTDCFFLSSFIYLSTPVSFTLVSFKFQHAFSLVLLFAFHFSSVIMPDPLVPPLLLSKLPALGLLPPALPQQRTLQLGWAAPAAVAAPETESCLSTSPGLSINVICIVIFWGQPFQKLMHVGSTIMTMLQCQAWTAQKRVHWLTFRMSAQCIKITERKNYSHAVNVLVNRMSDSVNKCGKQLPEIKKNACFL